MSDGSYVSRLDQSPLVEVLAKVAEYNVPGVVICENDGRVISIFVDKAELVYASEGEPVDELGRALQADGVVTEDEYRLAARRALEMIRSVSEELAAGGTDPVRMMAVARRLSREAIETVLRWDDGTVKMTPGRYPLPIRLSIPLGRVILDAVAGHGEPKAMTGKVGSRATILKRTERESNWLSATERDLLEQVDGKKTFSDLLNLPPGPPVSNVRMLYAFRLLQLIAPKQSVKVKMRVNE